MSACLLTSILRALFCMIARPSFNCTFYLQNCTSARVWRCHVTHVTYDQHPRTNYNTEFPLYLFPRPITIFSGAVLTVAARLLWVGLTCQSLHGHFSHLSFLAWELSTKQSAKQQCQSTEGKWWKISTLQYISRYIQTKISPVGDWRSTSLEWPWPWPWFRTYGIPSCIIHRPVPT